MDTNIPKKSLGQHWLNDEAALQAVVEAAQIGAGDTVLEIGPGKGSLTALLVGVAQTVIAVEYDIFLATALPRTVRAVNLSVIHQDILRYDFTTLPPDYKIAANIPYYLTSHLVRLLTDMPNQPAIAALLVQKEVAERMAAEPGDMSILAVAAQYYYHVSTGRIVGRELFVPSPKVDSQIVIMQRRSHVLFPGVDAKAYFRLVKAGFAQRRKTLENSLAGGLQMSKIEIRDLLERSQILATTRAQNLSLDDWRRLYDNYHLEAANRNASGNATI